MATARSGTQDDGPAAAGLTPTAFAERFRSSARCLWGVAAAVLGDADLADDVVQEAAVTALQRLDQFQPGTNFEAWMSQVVRFIALNHRRKRTRRRTSPVDPVIIDETSASAQQAATAPVASDGRLTRDQDAFDDDVVEALDDLDERTRCCLLLRVVQGMPYRQIALVLDVPEGTAMSCVHRARKLLRERLAPAAPSSMEGAHTDA